MKLISKTSGLFLGIGVFVILGGSLGMVRSQELREQSQIEHELSLAQLRLQKYSVEPSSSQQEELKRRLTEISSQLAAAKVSLSQSIESIEVCATLFDVAQSCGVEIIEVNSRESTDQELKGIACSFIPLTVRVEGDVANLIDFILKWSEDNPTGVIASAEITVSGVSDTLEEGEEGEGEEGGEGDEEENGEETQGPVSANIRLLIHTYRGD